MPTIEILLQSPMNKLIPAHLHFEQSKAIEIAKSVISRVDEGAFVSYSQHGEDVLLNRAFHGRVGKYIDIGSNHPIIKSVTYASYLKGWEGLSIDMDPSLISLHHLLRPTDVALQVAISDEVGEKHAYVMPGTTRSSLDEGVGTAYIGSIYEPQHKAVQCVTLMSVLKDYPVFKDCDFLNIDVEGHEAEVLRGIDFKEFHPKVIVVEAVHPINRGTVFHEWESILYEAGYVLALFDGLNGYFALKEQGELIKRLALPINYSDNYIRHEMLLLAHALINN